MSPRVTADKVEVENVSKVFGRVALKPEELDLLDEEAIRHAGGVLAVADASFSVRAGETFVIMGLSGSGKSTLLRCINRLIEPTAGRVLIDGHDVKSMDARELRDLRQTKLTMVFQSFALFPHMTILENVSYPLKVAGIPRSERNIRARDMLAAVGLDDWANRYPRHLSGGMQQRVGFARARIPDPDILLMDEPFGALDPLIRRDMQADLIRFERANRKTILFITHDLDEAVRIGDRIAIMHRGRIVQIGTPQEIVFGAIDEHVANFVNHIDRSRILTAGVVAASRNAAVRADEALDRAASELARQDWNHAFVLDDVGRPEAVVWRDDLGSARANDARHIAGLLDRDFTVVPASTLVSDCFSILAASLENRKAIAVVRADGTYVGSLVAEDILKRLGARGDNQDFDLADLRPTSIHGKELDARPPL